ncbi:MAG: hypothetical protein JEZ12_01595 [Desulfobacterium sp.]|nr:hypothetical protein [Desulfobacterium sp.]
MYRLSGFFISDIVAGENILRNGYFPIHKEGERADHGIIVAANGSCKTTLLSFLFSVFTPERRRFVQYLQSSGDKTLEQYLVPGRPAVVLLNLSVALDPTLFVAHPKEHLVLGQILYRHKSAPDKIDRSYFIANEPEFFNSFRSAWDTLSGESHPYTSVKEFMSGKVHQTSTQKEWEDKLESIGLDPWLMNRQVDFSRSEGGIKDAFKFKSEEEFLSFFLGCVADLDAAMKLRDNTAQTIDKMRNRPEKKKQLDAVLSIKKNMGEFHDMGKEWRNARTDVEHFRSLLGEGAHLLTAAEKDADIALGESEAAVRTNTAGQKQAKDASETAKANQVKVEEAKHARETRELTQQIQDADKRLADAQGEGVALKAAEYMASLRQFRAEAESKEKLLAGKDSQLEPARKQVALRAGQYHARLSSQRMEARSAITAMDKEKEAALEKQKALETTLAELRKGLLALNGELARLTAQITAARTARSNLGLVAGEAPWDARPRLEREAVACKEALTRITTRLAEIEAEQKQTQVRWQELHRSRIQGEEVEKQARARGEEEKAERAVLLADANLKTIAGAAMFEPTRADLATGLEQSMARTRTRTEALQLKLLETENELNRLENMDTLAVDHQVARLIDHYTAQGLSPAELKPFPDYLAGMYPEDPQTIAEVVEKDPGRFTGIMAVTDEVIATVETLPVPEWLHKPVVISTPMDLDRAQGIAFPVIAPADPMVYSKTYLEEQKERLAKGVEALKAEVAERISRLRSLEASARLLQDYRKKYPDATAVERLTRSVATAGENLSRIRSDIRDVEAEQAKQGARKAELEHGFKTETGTMARLEQVVRQVENWLSQYGEIKAWETALEQGDLQRVEMTHTVTQTQGEEKKTRETLAGLQGTMAGKQAELKNLEDRADDIPGTEGFTLTDKEQQEALSMDLSSLRRQHEEAQSNAIRIASDLGIAGLRKDLERVQGKLQKTANDLDRYAQANGFDGEIAEKWAKKSSRDRDERTSDISALLVALKEQRAKHQGQLEGRERDRGRCGQELKRLSGKGIHTNIDPEALEKTDPDGLILHYMKVAQTEEEKLKELRRNGARQATVLEGNRGWKNEIKLALATVSGQAPCWDSLSPRGEWPDLVRVENPARNAVIFRKKIQEILKARAKMESVIEAGRKNMGRAFDRLQGELRDENLKLQLPAIVDELSRHDAETLGAQSGELMEKCSYIAANIESDLSRSEQFVESLVDQLLQHVREAYQKLQHAAKQLMPDNVYVYGGHAILKAGTRLDFTRHGVIYKKSIDNWLDELIQDNRMPEVNPKVGDTLGTELLYRLLKTSSAKQEFGIRLLKCDDTGRNYEPVGKDLGSGGEALTTAVLLYSLLTSMRRKRRNNKDDRIPAFLIADNPLGVCNRSDFLDAQLKVARAMGIQCVYFTGINDRESLGLFQHRVAIRQSGKHLQVAGKPYNLLEIIEQNVEDRD